MQLVVAMALASLVSPVWLLLLLLPPIFIAMFMLMAQEGSITLPAPPPSAKPLFMFACATGKTTSSRDRIGSDQIRSDGISERHSGKADA
jgi:hypothetical protein